MNFFLSLQRDSQMYKHVCVHIPSCLVHFLDFLNNSFMRYTSQIMKFALLNYTIWWVLVGSQSFKIICCWAPKLCLTICHHMDCRTSGSSVLLSLGVCSNSCPLSSWCHATISCSATFFCLQPFPGSGSFPMSWLFTLGGQILELQLNSFFNEYSRLLSFRMDWFHLTAVQGTLKNLLQHHS